MMKKKLSVFYLALILSIYFPSILSAQVTIGSNQKPVRGAILDLKEDVTTKKGLGLPRVLLKALVPTGNDLRTTIDKAEESSTDPWDLSEHTGLLIYNAEPYKACDPRSFPNGVYVWDGSKWQYLGEDKMAKEVGIFVDTRDQEKYLYRSFGEAGTWMLENMRYKDNSMTALGITSANDRYYAYPKPNSISTAPGEEPSSWRPNQGLLYSYAAATMGAQDGKEIEEQGQEPGSIPGNREIETVFESTVGAKDGKIQGVCPSGWHVPSDREWNQLEKEIYNNPTKYSQYKTSSFDPKNWESSWETDDPSNPRGSNSSEGHGMAMLSTCFPMDIDTSIEGTTGGMSLSAKQGGFDALLTGTIIDNQNVNYGLWLSFWSSSFCFLEETLGEQGVGVWTRIIFKEGLHPGGVSETAKTINRFPNALQSLISVRCKKDK